MVLTELITQIRRRGNVNATGVVGDSEIADFLSEAQNYIHEHVRGIDQHYFEERVTVVVDSTGELELPASMRRRPFQDVRVIGADGRRIKLHYIEPQNVPRGDTTGGNVPYYWYLFGNSFGIWPRPTTSNVEISIVRRPTQLFLGRVAAPPPIAGATAFIVKAINETSGDIGTLSTSETTDFVGDILRFTTGTAQGQEFRVTSFNPVTRTFSLATGVPAGILEDDRMTPIPFLAQEFQDFLVWYAVWQIYLKRNNQNFIPVAERQMQRWLSIAITGAHRHWNDQQSMIPSDDMSSWRHPEATP